MCMCVCMYVCMYMYTYINKDMANKWYKDKGGKL
jgi:hypothetical protein